MTDSAAVIHMPKAKMLPTLGSRGAAGVSGGWEMQTTSVCRQVITAQQEGQELEKGHSGLDPCLQRGPLNDLAEMQVAQVETMERFLPTSSRRGYCCMYAGARDAGIVWCSRDPGEWRQREKRRVGSSGNKAMERRHGLQRGAYGSS
jgi:hypothetical protein